jgi:hypothetical protein
MKNKMKEKEACKDLLKAVFQWLFPVPQLKREADPILNQGSHTKVRNHSKVHLFNSINQK